MGANIAGKYVLVNQEIDRQGVLWETPNLVRGSYSAILPSFVSFSTMHL